MKNTFRVVIFVAFLLLFHERTFAQEAEPRITSISPVQVEEGKVYSISINGENFSTPITVTLKGQDSFSQELSASLKSNSLITAELPDTLMAGQYDLCVKLTHFLGCKEFQILQSQLFEIVSIDPTTFYSLKKTEITIVIQGIGDSAPNIRLSNIDSIWLGNKQLDIIDRSSTVVSGKDQLTIIVSVDAGTSEGEKELKIVLTDQREVVLDQKVTVLAPISAEVTSIDPKKVLLFDEASVKVKGSNFRDINSISWQPYGSIDCSTSPDECSQIMVSESELELPFTYYTNDRTGDFTGTIYFKDGSQVEIPAIQIIDRVFPWNANSWWLFAIFQISFGFVWLIVFRRWSRRFTTYIENKTAPKIFDSLIISFTGIGVAFVWFILAYFGSTATVTWAYYPMLGFALSCALIGLNFTFLLTFSYLTNKFHKVLPGIASVIIVFAMALMVFIIPFFATNILQPDLAIILETIVFIIVAILGTLGVETARRELEELKVTGVPDEVIYNRVEERLFSQGQLHAVDDFLELPRDRVVSVFSKFYSDNQNRLGMEFSDTAGTLRFHRYENIQAIQGSFAELRSFLESNTEISKTEVEKLERVLRKEFGFQKGKGLLKVKPSNTFFVHPIRPVGVESILPDPFPLIFHATSQAINNEELKELQDILNRLDIKTRFALLIGVNDPVITRERIQTQFGGIGRENIVVLAEKDCKEIIGNADELRLAFMKVLQKQVDLMIFSPYGVKGPTPVDMFFGRKEEISTVLEKTSDGSIAVLGARRIGKTSMLQACQRILEERGKLLLYLDCYEVFDYDTWLQRANLNWNASGSENIFLKHINDFPEWLSKLQAANEKKQIVFLLDEVDRLMAYDKANGRDEKLFRLFRSLAQEKRCQFIFSGERTILDQLSSPKSPFFNFATPIYLGLLDRDISDRIVIEPMSLIGTTLKDRDEILELVYKHSSGHPNLVQFICLTCLETLSQAKTRVLDQETIVKVVESSSYKEQYLSTYWSQATALEKAISVVVAETDNVHISYIMDRLKEVGFNPTIQDLQRGLRYLILSQLLIAKGNDYTIQPSMFIQALSIFPFEAWLKDFLKEQNLDGENS